MTSRTPSTLVHAKCWLALLALGWLCGASAQTLSDPTRPPLAWLAAQPNGQAAIAATAAEDAAPGLQMTVTGKSRRFAVVGGQTVKPGDKLGGDEVIAIKRDAVIVKGNGGAKALTMAPEVEKKVIAPESAQKSHRAASKGKALVNGGSQ